MTIDSRIYEGRKVLFDGDIWLISDVDDFDFFWIENIHGTCRVYVNAAKVEFI